MKVYFIFKNKGWRGGGGGHFIIRVVLYTGQYLKLRGEKGEINMETRESGYKEHRVFDANVTYSIL